MVNMLETHLDRFGNQLIIGRVLYTCNNAFNTRQNLRRTRHGNVDFNAIVRVKVSTKGYKAALASTHSSALREGRWNLIEGESLSRDSFVPLPTFSVYNVVPLSRQVVQIGIFVTLRMKPVGISHTFLMLLQSKNGQQ